MTAARALQVVIFTLLSVNFAGVCWAQDILPIIAKGSKFFDSSGKQFYIKGVVYDRGSSVADDTASRTDYDPLANPDQCALDAPLMRTLLVNTIRVYHVDSSKDHDACMKTFAEHGIYVALELAAWFFDIDQTNPKWNQSMFNAYTKTLDAFAQHDNLFAVYIGNEIVRNYAGSQYFSQSQKAAPYIRAAARDIKAYRDAQRYRQIPVGYASQDINEPEALRDYLTCGGDNSTMIDFFSLNRFSWCGSDNQTNFFSSGYANLYNASRDYPAPIFLSETGCNDVGRNFDDQKAVLGPQMDTKWSGNIIYEWAQEANSYGIVHYPTKVSSVVITGTPTPISPDFYSLQSQWDTLTPTGVSLADYTPTEVPLACPTSTSSGWTIDGGAPLPTIKDLVIPSKTITSGIAASASTPAATPSEVSNTPRPSGLSTGAKSGIGIAVPLAVIIVISLAVRIFRHKGRKRKANAGISEVPGDMQQSWDLNKPELHSDSRAVAQLDSPDARRELDGLQRHQLQDGPANPVELSGTAGPQELSTSASARRNLPTRS